MGFLLPPVGATRGELNSGKMASSRVTKKQDPPCDFPGVLLPRPPPAVASDTQFGAAEGNSRIVVSSDDRKASLPGRKVPARVRILSLLVVTDAVRV